MSSDIRYSSRSSPELLEQTTKTAQVESQMKNKTNQKPSIEAEKSARSKIILNNLTRQNNRVIVQK